MGVPAFFRWLSMKYTQIVTHCIEEKPKSLPDNKSLPPETSQPNPNSIEFDNLYLDMNGIIHPCTHPENKPAPKTESEMFHEIFLYIDRIFSVVRPRKLIYLAVDGVAPRAKMNQQRSRRFRAGKETHEKRVTVERIRADLRQRGAILPAPKSAEEHFDSNCITPGTPFMARLALALQYYVLARLEADAGWCGLQVVLSDASAPGEGEHKIMDFIRRQRASPTHDPNTRHCLCGADADLIMLGLATHEPYFTIIREEFKPNQPRPCDICGQMNHEMSECQGLPSTEFNTGATSSADKPAAETEFIFIHLNVLREYLQQELVLVDLTIPYDFERAIDDWVFMCFFVGNDFLPHLPSLEIREKAIDRLIEIYKRSMGRNNSWLTDSGRVNIERVQLIMRDLAMLEDEIFKSRRENELGNRQRNKERRNRNRPKRQRIDDKPFFNRFSEEFVKPSFGERFSTTSAAAFAESKRQALNTSLPIGNSRNSLAGNESELMQSRKRRFSEIDQEDEEERLERELDKRDEVKLWEGGYRPRYYQSKFGVTVDENPEFCVNVAHQYLRGLCWVLAYYYQGCVDWTWYYPYHYAPFAEDFIDLSRANVEFEKDTKPFNPLEQLMGVFPADSRSHVPPSWQNLMTDSDSPVIDFYPIDFKIDLNGKRYEWQGVALLPFVDEARLLSVLEAQYDLLTDEEKRRNVIGPDRYFVRSDHSVADLINVLYESGDKADSVIDPQLTSGVSGRIWLDSLSYRPGSTVISPIPAYCDDIKQVKVVSCFYKDPQYAKNFIFKAKLLSAVKMPDKTIGPNAIKQERKHFDTKPAARMINHSFGTQKIPQNFDFNSPNSQRENSFNNPRSQQSPYNRQNNQYNQLNNQYSQQNNQFNRPNNQYSPQNNQFNRPNNQYNPQNNQYNQYDSNNNTNESSYRRGGQGRYSDPNVFGRSFQQLPNSNPLARTPNNRNSYSNQPNNRGQSNWNNSGNNWR